MFVALRAERAIGRYWRIGSNSYRISLRILLDRPRSTNSKRRGSAAETRRKVVKFAPARPSATQKTSKNLGRRIIKRGWGKRTIDDPSTRPYDETRGLFPIGPRTFRPAQSPTGKAERGRRLAEIGRRYGDKLPGGGGSCRALGCEAAGCMPSNAEYPRSGSRVAVPDRVSLPENLRLAELVATWKTRTRETIERLSGI